MYAMVIDVVEIRHLSRTIAVLNDHKMILSVSVDCFTMSCSECKFITFFENSRVMYQFGGTIEDIFIPMCNKNKSH